MCTGKRCRPYITVSGPIRPDYTEIMNWYCRSSRYIVAQMQRHLDRHVSRRHIHVVVLASYMDVSSLPRAATSMRILAGLPVLIHSFMFEVQSHWSY